MQMRRALLAGDTNMGGNSIMQWRRQLQAFTLVELLVTVAVIGIMAGLLVPAVQRSRHSTLRSKDANNMRQIGAAILNYAGENNQQLPGPTPTGQQAYYFGAMQVTTPYLGYYLAPYLDCPTPSDTSYTHYICPQLVSAGLKVVQPSSTAYMINYIVNYGTGDVPQDALGRRALFGSTYYNPPVQPWRLPTLSAQSVSLNSLWILCDVDRQCTASTIRGCGWFSTLPATPVHGSYRNFLYADGHVESLSEDKQP